MKVKIYLRPDAHKCVAKGDALWSWHFLAEPVNAMYSGEAKPDHTYLGDLDVELPTPETAIHIALAELKKTENEIHLRAANELAEVEDTRSKLLSLTYTSAPTTEFDDVPF